MQQYRTEFARRRLPRSSGKLGVALRRVLQTCLKWNQIAFIAIAVMPGLPALAQDWRTYTNGKYHYEFQYPESCEVLATGSEKHRDGRTVRILRKHTTRLHGLDIQIFPELSLADLLSKFQAPNLEELNRGAVTQRTVLHEISWKRVMLDHRAAVQMESRFNANGELFMTTLIADNVVFTAHLPGDASFDQNVVNRIVSSFKFGNRVLRQVHDETASPPAGTSPGRHPPSG